MRPSTLGTLGPDQLGKTLILSGGFGFASENGE